MHRGKSEMSGELIVEDVEQNGDTHRRLVFLNSPLTTQSEARLIKGMYRKVSP